MLKQYVSALKKKEEKKPPQNCQIDAVVNVLLPG